MVKCLKTKDDFISFLKDRKVLRKFKENVKNNEVGLETDFEKLVDNAIKENTLQDIISDGFFWVDTDIQEEGFSFWADIESEWTMEYYK